MKVLTQLAPHARRRAPRRRGVLLLVVLGMLAMFAMIGLAFVMMAGHARDGAEALREKEFYVANPEKFTEATLEQILCGSNNPASVLQDQGLIEDVYGNNTVGPITIYGATPLAGGQVLQIQIDTSVWQLPLVGRVLTFTSGPAEGESVRILAAGSGVLHTTMPKNFPTATGGDSFIVNGPAFGGKGFGYNPYAPANAPELSAGYGSWSAIAPCFSEYGTPKRPLLALFPNPTAGGDLSCPGGANEPYDAVDFQNMLLAYQKSGGQVLSPSLHRPALIRYWFGELEELVDLDAASDTSATNEEVFLDPQKYFDPADETQLGYIQGIRELKRRIILRPLRDYHPDFTGSNPDPDALILATGGNNWDVDCDNDGRTDSIWVDIGLPIQTGPNGLRYKPLVAILCVDLDSRLNLNAHGCYEQTGGAFATPTDCNHCIAGSNLPTTPSPYPILDRGQGCGVAEVDLGGFLGSTNLSKLLIGNGTTIQGRYGADQLPGGIKTRLPAGTNAEAHFNALPGYSRPYDFSGYPVDCLGVAEAGAIDFGSPIDLKGGMQIALDWRGQPVYQTLDYSGATPLAPLQAGLTDALYAQPYEVDLSPEAPRGESASSADALFSPAELERILRPYDIDKSSLPNRLVKLVSGLDASFNRHMVTTESCDIASVPNAVTAEKLNLLAGALGVSNSQAKAWLDKFPIGVPQLLAIELVRGGMSDADVEAAFPAIGNHLLGPELMAGLPLNVNRRMTSYNDRLAMARQLYCMAMLLADLDYLNNVAWKTFTDVDPANGIANPVVQRAKRYPYVCRLLAQWAVNVVDFRLNDPVMTGFKYDIEPFVNNDTDNDADLVTYPAIVWDVNDNLAGVISQLDSDPTNDKYIPYLGLVWGCTRPELIISESFGLHDRRTTDEADYGLTTDTEDADPDFDQKWKPEASLFVELYNPWSANEAPHAGLCDASGGVLLDLATGGSPVWRLAITETSTTQNDLNHPDLKKRPALIRTAYFAKNGSATLPDDITDQLQPSKKNTAIAPVLPGRYAVIGPGNTADEAFSATTFGLRKGLTPSTGVNTQIQIDQTRRIVLTPKSNPDAPGQVQIFGDGDAAHPDYATLPNTTNPIQNSIQNPTAVIINSPRRLSVTEPVDGYSMMDASGHVPYTLDNGYILPHDKPLDSSGPYWDKSNIRLKDTGTYKGPFMVHLQRLANPTQPYNAETNPYLTIDMMPVDVTAFNGLYPLPDPSAPVRASTTCPTDGGDWRDIRLFSRERGSHDGNNRTAPNPWKQESRTTYTSQPVATQPAMKTILPLNSHNFDFIDPGQTPERLELYHSLGYLNGSYRKVGENPIDSKTLFGTTTADATFDGLYKGSPPKPFPWLNWNNRPYLSKYELMLVPNTPSSRLLGCFGLSKFDQPNGSYNFPNNGNLADLNFSHLMNFFSSGVSTPGTDSMEGSELHRIFDHVRVPSRFVHTREPLTGYDPLMEQYREITDRREPGRVNLNTVTTDAVINAVVPNMACADLNLSRLVGIDPAYPTRFQKVFQSANGRELVPTRTMKDRIGRNVNATLLRTAVTTPTEPFLTNKTAYDYCNASRNPYFAYETLTRLGNTAGTRSNVYAVWVTVGYFEVEPVKFTPSAYKDPDDNPLDSKALCTETVFNQIYPDGVRLGQEVGADTGEIKRHRAFFMIDRSIPVGFKRGELLNAKKAVLIQRNIE